MKLGFNTNGLAHHDCVTAMDLVGQLGFRSVGITLDHHCCWPPTLTGKTQVQQIKAKLQEYNLSCVIETGGRFVLDPWQKHAPNLMSAAKSDRQRRIDFYKYAFDIAGELNADCVSLWSGIPDDTPDVQSGLERLSAGLQPLLDHANACRIPIGFEPEPGMFIDTMGSFFRLLQWVDDPYLQLTLDVGHLFCQGELPMVPHIQRWADRIINVHIEDMRGRQHLHLMFGEGEMDFQAILQALVEIDYSHGLHVELSRDSHRGPDVARRSLEFLQQQLALLKRD